MVAPLHVTNRNGELNYVGLWRGLINTAAPNTSLFFIVVSYHISVQPKKTFQRERYDNLIKNLEIHK